MDSCHWKRNNSLISRGIEVNQSLRSFVRFDSCRFFFFYLWSYLKERVYVNKPRTLQNLKNNIQKEIRELKPETLQVLMEHALERARLLLYCHLQYHNDTINKQTPEDFFRKIFVPLTLLQGFEKGYSRFACERESETEHNSNISTPTLMAVSVVSFSFSRAAQPEAHSAECWLSLLHLISIFSGPQLIRAPRPQGLMWLSLPHLVYNSASNSNCNSSGAPRAPSAWCGFPYYISSITPSDL